MNTLSDTQIASAALVLIGQLPISDLNDTTPNATKVRTVYFALRDKLLRKYDWNFARKDSPLQWVEAQHGYQIPTDCLVVRSVNHNRIPWRVEGDIIKTLNMECAPAGLPAGYPTQSQGPQWGCHATYTAQITQSGLFDSSFTDLLTLLIASRVAYPITKDKTIAAMALQQFKQAQSEAQSITASEGYEDLENRDFQNSAWLEAHGGGNGRNGVHLLTRRY